MERTFAEKTGCAIYKYIQRRRLIQAAQKLVESNKPIVEIAYETNYSSQQAFTQAFILTTDEICREYRANRNRNRKAAFFLSGCAHHIILSGQSF